MTIQTGKRQPKTPWKATRKVLLEACGRDILTSELIRSTDMMEVLQEKALDKGVRKLTERLSNFPGRTVATVAKKPQCFRLRLLRCLAELEIGPDKKFLPKSRKRRRNSLRFRSRKSPEIFPGKTKQRVYDGRRRFLCNYKAVLGKGMIYRKSLAKNGGGRSCIGNFRRV